MWQQRLWIYVLWPLNLNVPESALLRHVPRPACALVLDTKAKYYCGINWLLNGPARPSWDPSTRRRGGRQLCDFKRSLYMHFSSSWACGHSVPARQLNLIGNEGQTKCESTFFFIYITPFFLPLILRVAYFLIFRFDFLLIFFRVALIFSSAANLAAMLSKWVNWYANVAERTLFDMLGIF